MRGGRLSFGRSDVFRWAGFLAAVFGLALTGCGARSGGEEASGGRANAGDAVPGKSASAPDFSLVDTQGQTRSLADFKGRVVMLDFWATWCPPCRMSIPAVQKLSAFYQGKNVQVLGINLDEDPDSARRFVADKKLAYPVLLGGASDVGGAYGVEGIPHFVLIDPEGRLLRRWSGFSPGMDEEWRAAIDRLLGA